MIFPIRDRARPHHQLRRPHPRRWPAEIRERSGNRAVLQAPRRSTAWTWRARACAAGDALVVVEGYMDVIALHQAGFTGAVAPLGTALTEEQLEELWRLSPEPVLCFDGDAAGARAAARAAGTGPAAAGARADSLHSPAARRRGSGHAGGRRAARRLPGGAGCRAGPSRKRYTSAGAAQIGDCDARARAAPAQRAGGKATAASPTGAWEPNIAASTARPLLRRRRRPRPGARPWAQAAPAWTPRGGPAPESAIPACDSARPITRRHPSSRAARNLPPS